MTQRQQRYITVVNMSLVFLFLFSSQVWGMSGSKVATDSPLVVIQKMKFIPQEITIKRGESVHWINREKRQYHSVWFEKSGDPEPDYLFPDEAYTRPFESIGSYEYRCGPHPEMIGVVHVVE